jgi:hypothetical protein
MNLTKTFSANIGPSYAQLFYTASLFCQKIQKKASVFDISVVSHPSIIFENKMADYQHFQDFNEINEIFLPIKAHHMHNCFHTASLDSEIS